MLQKHTGEWIGLREGKGVHVFDCWIPERRAIRKSPINKQKKIYFGGGVDRW